MTYCVGLRLNEGLVLLSDTRTNAGLDNIATYRKMFSWSVPGERVLTLLTAGNLAVTQAVISRLQEDIDENIDGTVTLLTAPSMFAVAERIGFVLQDVQQRYGPGLAARGESSDATLILAGQRKGGPLRLYMIYSAGNFIEATDDTPFFQMGEFKYGRPLLDRVVNVETSLADGVTAVLLSMASTIRSNLSVGMPLDLAVIREGTFDFDQYRRIEQQDQNFFNLTNAFSEALTQVFQDMRAIKV